MTPKKTALILASALFVSSLSINASTETTDTDQAVELDLFVVTATKTEKALDAVTTSVEVITQEDIEKIGATTLKDIFERTPGLILQYGTFSSGSSAAKGSVNIRGVGVTGSLWLLDGRRLAGEVKNPFDMDRIPASMIERIEVVKGPMSALYGADAVGGVINIITKKPKEGVETDLSVTTGANSHGDGAKTQLSLNTRGAIGQFRGSLYVSSNQGEPYSETEVSNTRVPLNGNKVLPSEHPMGEALGLSNIADSYDIDVTYREQNRVNTVGGQGEYAISDKLTVGAEFNWFDEEREGVFRGVFHPTAYISPQTQKNIPAYDVPVTSKDENTRLDTGLFASYEVNAALDLKLRAYRSRYDKENSTTLNNHEDFGYATRSASASHGMNGKANVNAYEMSGNWLANADHLLTGGVEYRTERREATVFSQSSDLDTREAAYSALYVQDDVTVNDAFSLTFGGRYDRYEQLSYTDEFNVDHGDKTDTETTFKVGGLYRFASLAKVRFNVAQGYRVPDLRESYIQKQSPAGMQLGAYAVDNRFGKTAHDLKAERAMTYELGLSGRNERLNYAVTLFYNDIQDKIAEVKVIGTNPQGNEAPYITFKNLNDVTTHGAELTLGYALSETVDAKLFWTELDTENEETGKALTFNPERVVSLGITWQATPALSASIDMTHTGEQRYITDAGEEAFTEAYALTHLNLNYTAGETLQWRLFGGINNVFDEDVDQVLGSNVGTYYFVGTQLRF